MKQSTAQHRQPVDRQTAVGESVGDRVGMLLTVLVMTLVMVQGLLSMAPDVYWDVDPRSMGGDGGGAVGSMWGGLWGAGAMTLGPAVIVWLVAMSIALSAGVLAWHVQCGRKLAWGTLGLFAVGAISVLWRATGHYGDMWRGGQWLAAGCLGLAVFHLVQNTRCRRLIVASLIAMLLPWLLNALYFVWVEHPMTITHYQENQAEILASRGWVAGSTAHQEYQRRLEFNDVVGSFGLSNVFGSIVAALTLFAAGLGVAMWRARNTGVIDRIDQRRGTIVLGLLVLAGIVVLGLTHSRGAVVAFVLGCVVLVTAMWSQGKNAGNASDGNGWRTVALRVCVGLCVLLPIALVVGRGMMPPPASAESDRLLSVLFRAHYWQGAWAMIESHPWLGVGPGRFKDAYTAAKPLINPEQVSSSHNMAIDWQAMLGIGGSAWMVLLGWWIWRACGLRPSHEAELTDHANGAKPMPAAQPIARDDLRWPGVLVGLVWLLCLWVEWPGLLAADAFLVFVFGGMGVLALIAWLARLNENGTRYLWDDGIRLGALAAGVMLLIHGQIEMTWFHDGAVAYAWVLLAVTGGMTGGVRDSEGGKVGGKMGGEVGGIVGGKVGGEVGGIVGGKVGGKVGGRWLSVVGLVVVAIFWMVWVAMPIVNQQQLLREAARHLQRGQFPTAMQRLSQAIEAWPMDPQPYRRLVGLQIEMADQLAKMDRMRQGQQAYHEAVATLGQANAAGLDDLSLLILRARLHDFAAERLGMSSRREQAVADWREVIARAPGNLDALQQLAQLLEKTGETRDAMVMYQRTLAVSDALYLDVLDQLRDTERAAIEARIAALEAVQP